MKRIFVLFVLLIFIALPLFQKGKIYAQSESEKLNALSSQIQQYQEEIKKLQSQASTLSNQIAQYDAQIKLTSLKILDTESKIELLGGRIGLIETSLESLQEAFTNRVERTYKMTRLGEPFTMLLASENLNGAVSSFHYLKKIQEADQDLLKRLSVAKDTYNKQKQEQEDLQGELEGQKKALNGQKVAKNNLLTVTKNDEKKYQSLLASVQAEFSAIQAIIAGRGQETEVRHVGEGEKIASIIQGPSCNSSGAHLHFIVREGSGTQNPFNYLRSGVTFENCSGSSCGSGDGDSFNPGGNWNWPINETIHYSQGYGSTWAVRNSWVGRIYQFHNGIDIGSNASPNVKAVQAGILYHGSYSGSGGCRLRYVRVDHDNSNLETFYLHINY